MGHLAQRYRDPARSGVYRVTDGAVPRAAAAEAGIASQVVIIEGLDRIAAEDFQAIADALKRIAAAHRERGAPFFAVLVDPGKRLPLPDLYKEKR